MFINYRNRIPTYSYSYMIKLVNGKKRAIYLSFIVIICINLQHSAILYLWYTTKTLPPNGYVLNILTRKLKRADDLTIRGGRTAMKHQ